MPQDSTLFNFLQSKTIDVWKHKLDWIAQHGGMVLLNLHPDYVSFNGSTRNGVEFSVQRYRELLEYIALRHRGQDWKALPKDVATYCEEFRPARATRRPKNICMLAYSAYESDARIVRYAQTLAKRGDHVDVVAYGERTEPLGRKEVDGVTLFKVQRRLRRAQKSPVLHLLPLLKFFITAGVFITRRHFRRRYDLIHVHNIPEWLVFAVSLPKHFGARILLDIHDLVPELFSAKFKSGHRSPLASVLRTVERFSCQFADHVIISNHLWKERLVKRSVPEAKCTVFFNNIDPDMFYRRTRIRHDDRKIILFPGSLQWHQGVDIAIKALPGVLRQCPAAEFHIYGEGGVIDDLKTLATELGIQKSVFFLRPVPVNKIPQILVDADVGVVPKRSDSFGNEAYSTKIMEFMSQGVPVVISRTAIDTYYFNETQVRFCEPGNAESFATGIVQVLTDQRLRNDWFAIPQSMSPATIGEREAKTTWIS